MSEPGTRRRIPFWLTLSLMANMLLVGLLVGTVVRSGDDTHRRDRMMSERPPVMEHASRKDREAIRRVMMESFKSARDEMDHRKAARAELGRALRLEPYDPDAVRAAFAELRRTDEAVHAVTHEALATRLGDLSASERDGLAQLLSREPGEGRRGRHPGGPPGPERD